MSQSFGTGVGQTAPRLVFAGDADDEMARWDAVRRAAMHWIPATRGGQGGRWERYGLGLDHEAITPEEGEGEREEGGNQKFSHRLEQSACCEFRWASWIGLWLT